MIKNELTVRQICIIMCALSASLKLMICPTALAAACANGLWLPVVVNSALSSGAVFAVCLLCSRTKKGFFALLSSAFGKVAMKVAAGLFALYFVLSAVIPMTEQQTMVHEVFYDTIPSILTFLPFFLLSLYAGAKGLTNAGRTAEICLPVFAVCMLFLVVMSLSECDFANLLPLFERPTARVMAGGASSLFRFDEGALMLIFAGKFRYRRGDAAKIAASTAAGGLIVAAVCAIFYAVYGALAPTQYFAISKIALFFPAINLIGRTDIVAVYALDMVMIFALVLRVQAASYCLKVLFGKAYMPAFSVGINAVLLALTLLLNNRFADVQRVGGAVMCVAAAIFSYAMPLVAWLAHSVGVMRAKREGSREKV